MYLVVGALIVALSLIGTAIYRRRRLGPNEHPPRGFVPTDELSIDPTTGVKQRVWFNPTTGERHYQNVGEDRKA
ncbi:hypothetical protein D7Z26_22565 [Cohnella endophytica]|uniref:Uncharacterized protein n=1 Tax=Cohnella endophytica TaxID=2419778 RepID=A0A494XE97_9BACL|nr:hypothetical protein [Cohnella endophytica]RKP47991.1 hypothetical protein D7Z26_22565 [Cohnella endophytica]